MAASSAKLDVYFACGHKRGFTPPYPEAGQDIYCLRCQNETTVVTGVHELFHVKCGDCRWGRYYGADKREASRAASMHALKFPHTVTLSKGSKAIAQINTSGGGQTELPFESLVRERHETTASVQRMLRELTIVTEPLPPESGG